MVLGFFLLRFLALPVSELALYELIWNTPLVRRFPVFVRKRVYNFAMLGYPGEAFLTLWARRRLPLVGTPEAAVAGMLIAEAGLSQILDFGLFFAAAPIAKGAPATVADHIRRPKR